MRTRRPLRLFRLLRRTATSLAARAGRPLGSLAALLACSALAGPAPARAGVAAAAVRQTFTDHCSAERALTPVQQHRLLRLAERIEAELAADGGSLAIVARAGQDLERFGLRYSHAGISLRESPQAAWAVRQLYYACDERRPRLFDQGLAGFVVGMDQADRGFVSIVLPPAPAADALARRALDREAALRLLAGTYSANAHVFGLRYQNCNQWLAELMGSAWGAVTPGPGERGRIQDWLREAGYAGQAVALGSPFMLLAGLLVPLLHLDDHPDDDLQALSLRVSLPEAIEAFVRQRHPETRRIEICHAEGRAVIRRGWSPLSADCRAQPGDDVHTLD